MGHYTASHWGIYEVEQSPEGTPRLKPFRDDPDPSPIGLYQLGDDLKRLRVARPAIRRSWLEHGPGAAPERRGLDDFVEVDWTMALDLVAREIARVREKHGNEAIFGGSYGWSSAGRFHHAQSQVHRFLNACGGYVRHADTYSLGAARVLMPHIVAPMEELMAVHTSWDTLARDTRLFVAFGGVPAKNTQISSGGAGDHRAREGLRRMAQSGTRFINVSPVRDNLETGGDVEWVAIRPNTDTALMLGLAWVLQDEGLLDLGFLDRYCTGFSTFERYLTGSEDGVAKDAHWAAAITGIAAPRIVGLAREMAASRTMLNVSWSLQRAHAGEQPYWMLITLAAMLGQIGLPGGGFGVGYGATNLMGSAHVRLAGPTLPQGANPVRAFIPVARISDMLLHPGTEFAYNGGRYTYPDIRLIYWAGGNPFHHHQDLKRLLRAWQKPDSIIVHEQFWTATAKLADVVLPATTSMERNDIGYSTREGYLVAMRQIVERFAEARDDFMIFAELAGRLGSRDAYTEGLDAQGWIERLYGETCVRARDIGISLPDFQAFWQQGIVPLGAHDRPITMLEAFRADPEHNKLKTPSGKIEIYSQKIAGFHLPDCPGHAIWREPPEWLGSVQTARFPLHLLSDQPARRLHSQLDASAFSRTGKINGHESVYMNPTDAEARGIADGSVVELFNERGRCLAGAVLTADIMAGVVRLSTGAWLDLDPDTGLEKHGNPNVLTLDIGSSALSQGCVAQTCLVEVRSAVQNRLDLSAHEKPALTAAR